MYKPMIEINDKIIEEFADRLITEILKGLEVDIKNEQDIIERFHAYLEQYKYPTS